MTDRDPSLNFGALFEEPYWKVQRGPQSCVEQSPVGEYLFLLGTGREYAILFRDELGIPVTVTGRIYAAKMKPEESIVIRLTHKGPFQAAAAFGEVQQQGESRWGENTMTIGWEPAPPQPPDYSVGQKDDASCALNEFSRCGLDSLYGTPLLRDPLRLVDGTLELPLIAKPTGRTTRG